MHWAGFLVGLAVVTAFLTLFYWLASIRDEQRAIVCEMKKLNEAAHRVADHLEVISEEGLCRAPQEPDIADDP
jgi:hypothetical protein